MSPTQIGRSVMHPFGVAMQAHDVESAVALLAEDVEFRSPVVFAPYRGRDAVAPLLYAVAEVLQDFRYTREIGAGSHDVALVFRARAGDRELEGCDFLHVDESGAIDELCVMIRPMSGIHALAEQMRAVLEGRAQTGDEATRR
ncbi:nuclear transport factor 2 family protein [Actinopolymorpha singaporensis]